MSDRPLADAEARARIRGALDINVVVEAAAGTGKTSELVARMLSVIGSGRAELSQIASLTFTEKAAGEMKLRLRSALERARRQATADAPERARFEAALAQLEAARISTIHGFCGDLLRERPIEAGVDPDFEVEGDDGAVPLFERAFDGWLQRILEDPPPGVRRALRRSTRTKGAQELLRGAARALIGQRDFDTPWERPRFERETELDTAFEQLGVIGALATIAAGKRDKLAADLRELLEFVDERRAVEDVRGSRDYDELEFELRQLRRRYIWKRKGYGSQFAPGLLRADVIARRDELAAKLDGLLDNLEAQLAAQLRDELQPVVEAYEAQKARAGKLDYLDLLIRTRNLLRDDAATRDELRGRITHLFVDEFQDTDPLQAEILLLLCSEPGSAPTADGSALDPEQLPPITPGKLFVVGDPKQAIYRFRRADVMLYEGIKEGLRAQGAAVLQLTTSFRALPDIQSVINASFEPLMQGAPDGSQANYQPLHPFRSPTREQPAVIALPVPRPYSKWGRVTSRAIDESLPDAIGAFIEYLTGDSGMMVSERGRDDVPLSARHICLLFRRFKGYGRETTRDYVRALEARRIPHVLVGGRSFHAREEVAAVRTALVAIEWPDDALSVFATLRGPLISLSDDALLDFTANVGSLHPLRPLDEDVLSESQREVADALSLLAKLHRLRNRRPAGETITALLEATRAHAGIAIWPTGEQALANVLRIADQARRFEQRGTTSFRAFVDHLAAGEEREEAREAPVVEEGTEGVRMMTVHAAKGLEFPVVILCDPTVPRTAQGRSRYLDTKRRLWACPLAGCTPLALHENAEAIARHDEDEEVRIAYVAATRARDLLVVPCVGDRPHAGWVDVLHRALYPQLSKRRDARPSPGCPDFGEDSVLEAPLDAQRSPEDSVAPGTHQPAEGGHSVTWWDPKALALGSEAVGGLRQDRLLTADDEGMREAQGQAFHLRWRQRRRKALERGAQRGPVVQPVTAIAAEAIDPPAVEVVTTDAPREGRPSGRRFGTLVHAVLEDARFRDDPELLTRIATGHARALGAPEAEVGAAVVAARHALAHELLQRAARSPDARFEAPMGLRLGDGRIAEGSIDLTFCEEQDGARSWTVIDFKTDLDPSGEGAYAAQLRMYAEAVERATGESVRAYLLAI